MNKLTQGPIFPKTDLRDMLRQYLVNRSLDCMDKSANRRQQAIKDGSLTDYCNDVKTLVRSFYGELPVGLDKYPMKVTEVSTFEKNGYRIENVLFDSFPGWQVNATVYVPTGIEGPFPVVIVPVGHDGKQFKCCQLPCQYFVKSGYLVINFDPPGVASEKGPGNDHFHDGVRLYPLGETSSKYFIADALRCIDYAESRDDTDLTNGVAMTGVSGGGTTTAHASVIDDRITVIGPSCCLAKTEEVEITQCYASCPETHMPGRYAGYIDQHDLLCATIPKPVCYMVGTEDTLYQTQMTKEFAAEVREFFDRSNYPDRFEFFEDQGPHTYSVKQAEVFTHFMDKWLRKQAVPAERNFDVNELQMNPYDELKCYPDTEVNMWTLASEQAKSLAENRKQSGTDILESVKRICNIDSNIPVPEVESGKPFKNCLHFSQELMLRPEEGIELPATFVYNEDQKPHPTLLHFDDNGRHRLVQGHGMLCSCIHYIQRDFEQYNLLTVDLRGWGDTKMSTYPYDYLGWGGTGRLASYMSCALGDHIMGMRVRDGLQVLKYLKSRPECDTQNIIITGCGLGAIAALHVATLEEVKGVVTWNGLLRIEDLIHVEHYKWSDEVFMLNILKYYDLPELSQSLSCTVLNLNPLNAIKETYQQADLDDLNRKLGCQLYANAEANQLVEKIKALLGQ